MKYRISTLDIERLADLAWLPVLKKISLVIMQIIADGLTGSSFTTLYGRYKELRAAVDFTADNISLIAGEPRVILWTNLSTSTGREMVFFASIKV